MWIKLRKKYINLQEAARISGYSSDYIGYLIRRRKIEGKKVYINTSWQISSSEITEYCRKIRDLDVRDHFLLQKKYLSLKEAAQILGYTPDYIGYLIRKGRISGNKVYSGPVWLTTEETLNKYQKQFKIKNGKLKITLPQKELTARLVFDIFPPEKIQKMAREIAGLKPYKTTFERIFSLGWRLVLVAAILFLLIGIGPVEIFNKLVGALTDEERTINFYSTLCEGAWQNPQNAQGQPEVGPEGDFNSFSETNSAVYKTGSLNLVCQDFKTNAEQTGNNIQQPVEQQPEQPAEEQQEIEQQQTEQEMPQDIPEEKPPGQETPIQDSQPTEPESPTESPTSFLEK